LEKVPPSVVLIGIVPQDLDLGTELSPTIEAALDEAQALLIAEIESLGFRLRP
jgi:Ni,Fe-hydrogenase maturation factor